MSKELKARAEIALRDFLEVVRDAIISKDHALVVWMMKKLYVAVAAA